MEWLNPSEALNNNIRRAHRPHRENVGRMSVADRLELNFLGPLSNSGFKTGPVKSRPNLEKWMFSKLSHPILARVGFETGATERAPSRVIDQRARRV